jgi:hypothetical protein
MNEKRSMRRKNVNNSRIVSLLSLASFALMLAVPAQAQNDAAQKMDQYLNQLRPQKPASDPSSSADQSQSGRPKGVKSDATTACSYPFTSSGATYMNYCVTANGTLANFESPAGVEMLDQLGAIEGYGVCVLQTGGIYYDDNFADSGNWLAPVTLTQNDTEVKIERTPVDGSFVLTQTITKITGGTPAAKIVMTLKNTSGVPRGYYLIRSAEFVPDQAGTTGIYKETFDASNESAWGYIPYFVSYSTTSGPYGLMLNDVGEPTPASTSIVHYGYVYNSPLGPNPCQPLAFDIVGDPLTVGTLVNGVGSGAVLYALILNNEQTATVALRYFGF